MSKREDKNLPAVPARAAAKRSVVLDRIRAAKPVRPLPGQVRADLAAAAVAPTRRPRLVFAFDATASREPAWEQAKLATDSLFNVVNGDLDIALAVHGGGHVHTFTPFSDDHHAFRDQAAGVTCRAGYTALVPLMEQVLQHPAVKVLLYIGDCFEENARRAYEVADSFKARGIRAVILHDTSAANISPDEHLKWQHKNAREVFDEIARRTGGVCVDFHGAGGATKAAEELRELLAAVAVLAAGGKKLLEQKKAQLPGAIRLLPYID